MRGRAAADRLQNPLQHPMRRVFDLAVGEPQQLETLGAQPGVASVLSFPVVERRVVHPAVEFDDQPPLQTGEIGDVNPDRNLTAELQAIQAASAQDAPEPSVGDSLAPS